MIRIQLTSDQFAARRQQVSQQIGQQLTGNSGTIQHKGCTVHYNFDGSLLELSCDRAPFPIKRSYVESKVQEWFTNQR